MNEPAVSLRGVTMYFQDYQVRALTAVALEVSQGEIFALVGPARSGKSTVLKLAAGRLSASEGAVRVFGRSPRRSAIKARIGYLPEPNPPQPPPGWLARWFSKRRTPDKPLAPAQRLASLREAILGQRDLLVLDEPFTGLDAAGQAEVADLIRTLAGRGKTVLFSAALLEEARHWCDRLAVLYGGAVQAAGTMEALLATTDSIRFFGPVLAPAAAERVAKALRAELRNSRPPLASAPALAPMATPTADDRLAHLTKPQL